MRKDETSADKEVRQTSASPVVKTSAALADTPGVINLEEAPPLPETSVRPVEANADTPEEDLADDVPLSRRKRADRPAQPGQIAVGGSLKKARIDGPPAQGVVATTEQKKKTGRDDPPTQVVAPGPEKKTKRQIDESMVRYDINFRYKNREVRIMEDEVACAELLSQIRDIPHDFPVIGDLVEARTYKVWVREMAQVVNSMNSLVAEYVYRLKKACEISRRKLEMEKRVAAELN